MSRQFSNPQSKNHLGGPPQGNGRSPFKSGSNNLPPSPYRADSGSGSQINEDLSGMKSAMETIRDMVLNCVIQ